MQKTAAIFLSLLLVVFAALQVRGAEDKETSGVTVQPDTADGVPGGLPIDGEIQMTAALAELSVHESVTVEFMLHNNRYTYTSSVVVTKNSENEDGLFAASTSFGSLPSGVYTVYIKAAENAELSYMLAEKGSESKYTMAESSMTFYLSEDAPSGSAWFMLEETDERGGDS